jgi:hypothetical protein
LTLGPDPGGSGSGDIDVEHGHIAGLEAPVRNLQDVVRQLQRTIQQAYALGELEASKEQGRSVEQDSPGHLVHVRGALLDTGRSHVPARCAAASRLERLANADIEVRRPSSRALAVADACVEVWVRLQMFGSGQSCA